MLQDVDRMLQDEDRLFQDEDRLLQDEDRFGIFSIIFYIKFERKISNCLKMNDVTYLDSNRPKKFPAAPGQAGIEKMSSRQAGIEILESK